MSATRTAQSTAPSTWPPTDRPTPTHPVSFHLRLGPTRTRDANTPANRRVPKLRISVVISPSCRSSIRRETSRRPLSTLLTMEREEIGDLNAGLPAQARSIFLRWTLAERKRKRTESRVRRVLRRGFLFFFFFDRRTGTSNCEHVNN